MMRHSKDGIKVMPGVNMYNKSKILMWRSWPKQKGKYKCEEVGQKKWVKEVNSLWAQVKWPILKERKVNKLSLCGTLIEQHKTHDMTDNQICKFLITCCMIF